MLVQNFLLVNTIPWNVIVLCSQRIRHYIEWSSECIEFHILKEVHSGFLECFLNQPLDECSVMYYCSSEKGKQTLNYQDIFSKLWECMFTRILSRVVGKSKKISIYPQLRSWKIVLNWLIFFAVSLSALSVDNGGLIIAPTPVLLQQPTLFQLYKRWNLWQIWLSTKKPSVLWHPSVASVAHCTRFFS